MNDPRGVHPTAGVNKQVYAMGDFEGYNSGASAAYVSGDPEITINMASGQTSTNIDIECVFNLGEVDWFGDEPKFWGRNNIPYYNQIHAVRVEGSTKTVIGTCNKEDLETSGYNSRAIFPITLRSPSYEGGVNTYVVNFALGQTNKAYAYFPPEIKRTYNVVINPSPQYLIQIPSSAYVALKDALVGLSSQDESNRIGDVVTLNGSGTLLAGSNYVSVNGVGFEVVMYPTFNRYSISQLRWQITGKILTLNKDGVQQASQSFAVTLANQGGGLYNFYLPLDNAAAEGKIYVVNIETFGSTIVYPLQ